jgi:hypothetical protein
MSSHFIGIQFASSPRKQEIPVEFLLSTQGNQGPSVISHLEPIAYSSQVMKVLLESCQQ